MPLVHPISGVLEGILDLTCLASETNELMLPLLLEASRHVRDRLVADSSPAEQALLASFLRATRRTRRPVVCLNDHIVISNDAARGLAPADYALLWEQFAAAGARTAERVVARLELSEGRVYEARFGPVEAGIGDGGRHRRAEATGADPPRRAARRHRRPARGPALAGHSDAWRRVVAEIERPRRPRSARCSSPALGASGKLRCATAIHARSRRGLDPVTVLDASMSVADLDGQWIEPLLPALAQAGDHGRAAPPRGARRAGGHGHRRPDRRPRRAGGPRLRGHRTI